MACSAPADEATSSGLRTAAPIADVEAGRVRTYLDSLYQATDVRHTFVSAMGDAVDCVDFASAPGVKKLLAEGQSMESIMAPFQRAHAARSARAATPGPHRAYFEGDLDADGNARSCAEGTYPHLHVTPETIAAYGGLDAYLKRRHTAPLPADAHPASAVPADGGLLQDIGHYAWVMNDFSPTHALSSIQGGTSTMTIAEPTLDATTGDHSLAQVWLTGNDANFSKRQTLEGGWEATSLGTAGPRPAQLFVGTTPDGYATWCEDGNPNPACPAWIPNPENATLMLEGTLTASTPGGAQHELTMAIEHPAIISISCGIRRGCTEVPMYHGWDFTATVDNEAPVYLGYFANAGYSGGLSVGGDDFQLGGEVYDTNEKFGPPPEITMGEGVLEKGVASYGSSAYHHDFGYWDSSNTFQTGGSVVHNTNTSYVFNTTAAPGSTAWANYFYYGDYGP